MGSSPIKRTKIIDLRSKRKKEQLGLSISSAVGKLRKNLLFAFTSKLGLNICYRCSKPIESVEDFTMDHKINWQGEPNAKELFFDLENIGFSHHLCNAKANRITEKGIAHPSFSAYKKGCRCAECTQFNTEAVRKFRSKKL